MRKKLLLLGLALAAVTASLSAPRVEASGGFSCPRCVTYADGSQCCVSCWCDKHGNVVACTDHFCPPPGGIN